MRVTTAELLRTSRSSLSGGGPGGRSAAGHSSAFQALCCTGVASPPVCGRGRPRVSRLWEVSLWKIGTGCCD